MKHISHRAADSDSGLSEKAGKRGKKGTKKRTDLGPYIVVRQTEKTEEGLKVNLEMRNPPSDANISRNQRSVLVISLF